DRRGPAPVARTVDEVGPAGVRRRVDRPSVPVLPRREPLGAQPAARQGVVPGRVGVPRRARARSPDRTAADTRVSRPTGTGRAVTFTAGGRGGGRTRAYLARR